MAEAHPPDVAILDISMPKLNGIEVTRILKQKLPQVKILILTVHEDEAYVYLDALRQGRRVVVALADDDTQAAAVRAALLNSGAESLDAARERWWVGLRDVERQRYVAEGRDFEAAEPIFRQGFEAGLRLPEPGQSYGEAQGALRDLYPDVYDREEFRDGYERGVDYSLGMRERRDRAA